MSRKETVTVYVVYLQCAFLGYCEKASIPLDKGHVWFAYSVMSRPPIDHITLDAKLQCKKIQRLKYNGMVFNLSHSM